MKIIKEKDIKSILGSVNYENYECFKYYVRSKIPIVKEGCNYFYTADVIKLIEEIYMDNIENSFLIKLGNIIIEAIEKNSIEYDNNNERTNETIHNMKLYDISYYLIKRGENIEIRLYDEKRKKLKIGDIIIFSQYDIPDNQIKVKIKGLFKFNNFEELISYFKEEFFNIKKYREIYTEEQEKKYGVLGIYFELLEGENE